MMLHKLAAWLALAFVASAFAVVNIAEPLAWAQMNTAVALIGISLTLIAAGY